MLQVKRDGPHTKKVYFDCERIGTVKRLSLTCYEVTSLKHDCVRAGSMSEAMALFHQWNWRSVVGRSDLSVMPPKKYEPKREKLTKKRWSIS
jgi:hypothetical protein